MSPTRFIAKYGRYTFHVRHMITEAYATGGTKVVQTPLYAQFHEGGLKPEERELAIASWTFNGFYQEQDEVTQVAPDYRIGIFDTELAQMAHGWSDEDRELVEQTMSRACAEGHPDMIEVPRTLIPPPWPRYDEFRGTPAELVERLLEDGHNIDAVITYEKAMQNRPVVIAALENAVGLSEGFVEYEPEEEEILG